MSAPSAAEIRRTVAIRVVLTLAVLAAGALAMVSIVRAGTLRYDFHHFYYDARYLLEHGQLNVRDDIAPKHGGAHLPWYLPVVTIALTPIAALGPWLGGTVWWLINIAALLLTIWMVGSRLTGLPPRDWPLTQAIPVWLCAPVIYEHARFNQLSLIVLVLVVASFVLLSRQRDHLAGLALAAASVLKLAPAILLVWLVLKRRWRALATALAGIAVLALVPCLLLFGPARTIQYHRRWVGNAFVRASPLRMLIRPDDPLYAHRYRHFLDHRNQSLAMVVGRIAGLVPGLWSQSRRSAALLITAVVAFVGLNIAAASALCWSSRRRWQALRDDQRACELALWLLAMLWFCPLMRQYYLVLAYPAIAILLARLDLHRRARQPARMCWIALGAWLLAMVVWGVDEWLFDDAARKLGVNLWTLLILAVALVIEHGRGLAAGGPAPRSTDPAGQPCDQDTGGLDQRPQPSAGMASAGKP